MSRPDRAGEQARESVAVVVVTHNRADLLVGMLEGLAGQTRPADLVLVVDNASTDHTAEVLRRWRLDRPELPLEVLRSEDNLGGAGGFHLGLRTAHEQGHDRFWLMDDDVVPAPDCLAVLLGPGEACVAAVREDSRGRLVEKAALRFDLRNPLAVRPKTAMVETTYGTREAMPERVALENVAFEGFMVRRDVVDVVGLPDPAFFIFYDDCDYAIRARRAGFTIWGLRDARLVRQFDFDQQHDLSGWKGFYMYRNLFVVHFRHGENAAVRLKPYAVTAAVAVLATVRRRPGEARNVVRALASARGMRSASPGP